MLRCNSARMGSRLTPVRLRDSAGRGPVHVASACCSTFPVAQDASWWEDLLAATRILLVEDEGLIRLITADILRT